MERLDSSKATQETTIPTKIVKGNADYLHIIFQSLNKMIVTSDFSAALKLASITSVFKKPSKNSKENYRRVSVLTNVSKIYERLLFRQINYHFEGLFSKY